MFVTIFHYLTALISGYSDWFSIIGLFVRFASFFLLRHGLDYDYVNL